MEQSDLTLFCLLSVFQNTTADDVIGRESAKGLIKRVHVLLDLASFLWDNGKHCRTRSDTAEPGV